MFIAIDVETTGFSPLRGSRVIEIAAVAVHRGAVIDEFHSLIDAGKSIPFSARQVHGITDEMLIGKPLPDEVYPRFRSFIRDGIVVAHNAVFDVGFLRHEFGRLGMGFTNRFHCTMQLSRKRYPDLPNHRLETVFRHVTQCGPGAKQSHRALDDARMVAKIWMEMTKKMRDGNG